MNTWRRRDHGLTEAIAEHRRREDSAPRLRDEVPKLATLRLTFDDIRTEGRVLVASYARPIVVTSAPAHFEVRCMEPRCDGRHDLTQTVLSALRGSKTSFTGQSNCEGLVGDMPCDRTLAFAGEATYTV